MTSEGHQRIWVHAGALGLRCTAHAVVFEHGTVCAECTRTATLLARVAGDEQFDWHRLKHARTVALGIGRDGRVLEVALTHGCHDHPSEAFTEQTRCRLCPSATLETVIENDQSVDPDDAGTLPG